MWSTLESEIEASRSRILAALEGASEFTLVRGYGNIGDQLIYAGTRALFSGRRYREVSVLELEGITGQLGVVIGGGAWCRAFEGMAIRLPEIEQRFERVIVLPSSFDLESRAVSTSLSKTKALAFARERTSYEQIRGICQAELALDCAFFFDYAPYRKKGRGVLKAFRTDAESSFRYLIPPDNNDISATCRTLDEWLWTIVEHEWVHTDRAHVMIAGIMLGKRVAYRPSNYHKLPAIAAYSLGSIPPGYLEQLDSKSVRQEILRAADKSRRKIPAGFAKRHAEVEVTVVLLSYNRSDLTLMALKALETNVTVPYRLIVVDNNSEPQVRSALKELQRENPQIELFLLDENLGCAGGRAFAFQHVTTPYVLLIDNDVEILPGALEHLLTEFDKHPEAVAVTGRVVFPDGITHICGGSHSIEDGVLYFGLMGGGSRFDEIKGRSGECRWVPGCLTLVSTRHLKQYPYDLEMRSYYEDLDWCLEIEKNQAGKFYRSLEAIGIHYHEEKMPGSWLPIEERLPKVIRFLETLSYFYKKHGVVVEALFHFVPELGSARNPVSVSSARLLLDLVAHPGSEWVIQKWIAGALAPLFVVTSDYERHLYNEVESLRRHYESFSTTRSWKLVRLYWWARKTLQSLNAKLGSLTGTKS
ncbi:MAG: glycosyltransferase [Acidobacteriota bacterium]